MAGLFGGDKVEPLPAVGGEEWEPKTATTLWRAGNNFMISSRWTLSSAYRNCLDYH